MSSPGHHPERAPTVPTRWHLCDGHLEPDPGAPACPGCLSMVVRGWSPITPPHLNPHAPEKGCSHDEPGVTHP